MAIVAQGQVADRPFARTIYAVAARRFTGDLVLDHAGKEYRVTWRDGFAVAASSPSPADSAARQAVTTGLVNTTQVSEVLRQAQISGRSQLEVIAEVAALSPEQIAALEKRVLAYQAVRIFALPGAAFRLEDVATLASSPAGEPLDPRWLMYNGPRAHYDEQRVIAELGASPEARFQLAAGIVKALAAFGFGDDEKPALAAMRDQALTAEEIAAAAPGLGRTRLLCMLYALACAEGATVTDPRPGTRSQPAAPAPARPQAPKAPPAPAAATHNRVRTGARRVSEAERGELAGTVRRLIGDKLSVLEAGADLFQLLGLTRNAGPDKVRSNYFDLARKLHPDRLHALGIHDLDTEAQRVFAEINRAFALISDPKQREDYVQLLAAGGEKAVRAQERRAEEMALKIVGAEEQYQIGEMALRRQQFEVAREHFARAVELNPDEGEHHAGLAWATWCTASAKDQVIDAVKKSLGTAIAQAPRSPTPYFYRGQIAKHRGDVDTAAECFRKVLELDPGHRDAQLELRLLDKRGESKPDKKAGKLLDRLRRK